MGVRRGVLGGLNLDPHGRTGGMTHQEIAACMGLSRNDVAAIEKTALEKLRTRLEARGYTARNLLPDHEGDADAGSSMELL